MNKNLESNQVTICGEIASEFRYSHEVYGEKFYVVDVKVPRISDTFDIIPVMVSERMLDVSEFYIGLLIRVVGQFRSYNRHEDGRSRLILTVFAMEAEFVEEITNGSDNNQIYLVGYVCKEPIYRTTPLGREIADIVLAVNRPYGKSDYLPCICWGRNAKFASSFHTGTKCAFWGRIQSREYVKALGEGAVETRVAYEVSISKMEVLKDEK